MKLHQALSTILKDHASPDPYISTSAARNLLHLTATRLPALGTILNLSESTPEKLVFSVKYRHPDKRLSYHHVKVRPSLADGLSVKVTGLPEHEQTRQDIAAQFKACLERELETKTLAKTI